MIKISNKIKLMLAAGLALALVGITAIPALAIKYGAGYYGECPYSAASTNCDISISNNSFTLFLNITPTTAGSCTIQSDQVSVTTYDPSGYTLTLGNTSTNTGLLNGSFSIPASTGTPASPQLLSDTWGYRVDTWSGFGAGPTTAQTNGALSSLTFAGAKASNLTADSIAQTASEPFPFLPVSTTVWYGVCLNTGLAVPAGSYTSTLLYTATAN